MLSEILIGKGIVNPAKADLHRHATFSCAWARLVARVARLLGQQRRY